MNIGGIWERSDGYCGEKTTTTTSIVRKNKLNAEKCPRRSGGDKSAPPGQFRRYASAFRSTPPVGWCTGSTSTAVGRISFEFVASSPNPSKIQQAFLFSALDHEVSRGPIDFRRDWTDEDDAQPRWVYIFARI